MEYSELRDEINYLGYRATFKDFTAAEEKRLATLLAIRENYAEHEIEKLKTEYLLSQMRR